MKFYNLLTFVLFSIKVSSVNGVYCGTVPETTYTGIAQTVDVDNSAGFSPTTGDVSIAELITPVDSTPFSDVSIKAICTLTASNPAESAPFCTFESTLNLSSPASPATFQGKTMAMGTPPLLAIMGGMGDFMGAYGQFDTLNSFVTTPNNDGTINIQFSAVISFCIPDDQPPTGPSPPTGSPPTGSPPTGSPPTVAPPCVDSKSWKAPSDNGKKKDCVWVSRGNGSNPSATRCAKMGSERLGGKKTSGFDACPLACGMC